MCAFFIWRKMLFDSALGSQYLLTKKLLVMEKKFEKINALRKSCAPVHSAAGTFNQAVKTLQGLEKKQAETAYNLGITNFNFKTVCAAWSDALRLNIDGKQVMGLYLNEAAKITITGEDGQPKEVNAYYKHTNKKGDVSFRSIKLRTLGTPARWDDGLILEGLCQSKELAEAQAEAAAAQEFFDNLLCTGEVYYKVTEKATDGSSNIRFEKA